MKIGQKAIDRKWFRIETLYGSCEVALDPSPKEYRAVLARLSSPYASYQRQHDGELPPAVRDDVANQAIAEGILRDWREIDGEDGEPLEFTPKNAVRVMEDPAAGEQFKIGIMNAVAGLWDAYAGALDESEGN